MNTYDRQREVKITRQNRKGEMNKCKTEVIIERQDRHRNYGKCI